MNNKQQENIKIKLSKFGVLQVCSFKEVLTVLITGENLTKLDSLMPIQKILTLEEYPNILVFKNEDNFLNAVFSKPHDVSDRFNIDEVWDTHHELIGDDIDAMNYWTHRNVMTKSEFVKACEKLTKQ